MRLDKIVEKINNRPHKALEPVQKPCETQASAVIRGRYGGLGKIQQQVQQ
jgi:hypothetical protein